MIALLIICVPLLQGIYIEVSDTHPIPYATDIQDICVDNQTGVLAIRSNADGKVYLADNETFEYISEITMPPGISGFGLASNDGSYYINSDIGGHIYTSDGADSWSTFTNPAGLAGAGMDFSHFGPGSILEATVSTPWRFYAIEPDGSAFDYFTLPGITEDLSGFMGHEICADLIDPPGAAITTTRLGHEFFFYMGQGGNPYLYGQEPCPFPVQESLGLSYQFKGMNDVLWSYRDMDGNYCIAELWIPVFGDIEDETTAVSGWDTILDIASNPAPGSANLTVNMPEPAFAVLDVYDVSGRLVETVQSGQLPSGLASFSFESSPGLYIAVLRNAGQEQTLKFMLTR